MDYGFLSLLPPLAAIFFALVSRQVYISLFAGIWIGEMIIGEYRFFPSVAASLERMVSVFDEGWVVKTLIFAFLVGAVIMLISVSGGVSGFIRYISQKYAKINTKRGSLLLAYVIGLVIFIESSITALIAGTVAKPLTDRCRVSREKLAFVCDSTSAPVCSLIPFNAWGALLLGLIAAQITAGTIRGNAVDILTHAVALNFYAIVTLIVVFYVIWTGRDFGPMKRAEERAQNEGKLVRDGAVPVVDEEMMNLKESEGVKPDLSNMLLPLIVLVGMVPLSLYITGEGSILAGSGSTAIFWSVLTCVVFCGLYYIPRRVMGLNDFIRYVNKGSAAMFPVVSILIFAFAIGGLTIEMKTGEYLASLSEGILSPHIVAALVFLMAGVISFSTGTSWGTFSIMMPIAVQMGAVLGADIYLVVAAVISGGVFGDHCSVISDTTIVSSMAAGSDHIDHVNTQLPYALLSGAIAMVLFLVFGFFT